MVSNRINSEIGLFTVLLAVAMTMTISTAGITAGLVLLGGAIYCLGLGWTTSFRLRQEEATAQLSNRPHTEFIYNLIWPVWALAIFARKLWAPAPIRIQR